MVQKYYKGTPKIINEATEIGRLLGILDGANLQRPRTELRRKNRVKTIRASLAIEGNTLSEDQITDLINNKRVVGSPREILEVKNAITVYDQLDRFDAFEETSYLRAHGLLMRGLVEHPGQYRTGSVGIFKGDQVAHLAPPAWNVHHLMQQLFTYLRDGADNLLIKSCVFHYEMEFVHPFMDGNGRMGRLWQTIILMQYNPIFQFLPIETEIRNNQEEYYEVLAISDRTGMSTKFIEYMLERIRDSIQELVVSQRANYSDVERIRYFAEVNQLDSFTRKDYSKVFKSISSSTATRDLKKGVEMGVFLREGTDRLTKYRIPRP